MSNIGDISCVSTSWAEVGRKLVGLSFITANLRSMSHKFGGFLGCLEKMKNKPTFITVTETWLNSNNDFMLEIPGYKSNSLYRRTGSGGGIKVYFRETISVEVIYDYTWDLGYTESLFCALTCRVLVSYLSAVYTDHLHNL